MTAVVSTLIELDERGIAWITGTKVKVIEVATDKLAHGSSPEEMHVQYPHLSLAQIYAALAYYYEHQAEFETEILHQAERALAARRRVEPRVANLHSVRGLDGARKRPLRDGICGDRHKGHGIIRTAGAGGGRGL